MKKFIALMLAVGLVGVGFAADYTPSSEEDSTDSVLAVDVTASGDLTVAGIVTLTPTAENWTDGSTNTLAAGAYLISGTGGANDTTNTVVLANPTTAGDTVLIVVDAASTNLITIADSGNVAASGAILLDASDAVLLYAPTTSLWVEVPGDN